MMLARPCDHCSLPLPVGRGQGRRTLHDECKLEAVNLPRRCKKCRKVKPAGEFSRDASRSEGRFPYCMSCHKGSEAKFQNESLDLNGFACPVDDVPIRGHVNRRFCSVTCKEKASGLRKKYGMNIVDYRRLLEDAKGVCPICKKRPTLWQVDHNHASRMAAGVVCINCNVGLLAHSGHDLAVAESLVAYLRKTPCERLGIEAIAPETATGNRPPGLHRVWGYKNRKVKP